VTQYQMAGANARLKAVALLAARAYLRLRRPPGRAGGQGVARAQSEVVELDGMAPASRGVVFADGWAEGRDGVVSEGLGGHRGSGLGAAWRGVRSSGAAELAVHIADVRWRERANLVRREAFVRETVLPRTHRNARRGAG
jgi:hypothetical protein